MKKIIVLFKSHFDLGFTDFATEVIRQYNEEHIPRAIAVGEEIRRLGRSEGFVWTTGSFLIHQYLNWCGESERIRMENAVKNNMISWHGLPFTMHSEFANADLYRYGLSISKELDKRFDRNTTGAKITDVPGHTRGIVPLLAQAGINFLHIGVNAASPPPDVPPLFRWVVDSNEITVMYNSDYGIFTEIPGTDTAICFGLFCDNYPPPSADEVIHFYDQLHEQYPEAQIVCGDLNDVANVVAEISGSLPVITQEIGDNWIHGVGADPMKTSQYRSLLRFAKNLDGEIKQKMYTNLFLIPEHTWGGDEKVFLNDRYNYKRELFDIAKNTEKYKNFEKTWEEQRGYISKAVDALDGENKLTAEKLISEYKMEYPDLSLYNKSDSPSVLIKGWEIGFDDSGAVVKLSKNGINLASEKHPLGAFLYEAFSEKQVWEYISRYETLDVFWASDGFGKLGLGAEMDKYESYNSILEGVYYNEDEVIAILSVDDRAYNMFGCPQKMILRIAPEDNQIHFDFAWFDKPANRIPEALWLQFGFSNELLHIKKLDNAVDPKTVISNGNREMHSTDGTLLFDGLELYTYDAPLFAIEKPACYAYYNKIPDMKKGVYFNLFNNQWGTNFPMWNSGDARFRFNIILN